MTDPNNCADFSPEQKIEFLKQQILAAKEGEIDALLCPYCGGKNTKFLTFLCCSMFKLATDAILNRMEGQDTLDFAENVADRTYRDMAKNAYKN